MPELATLGVCVLVAAALARRARRARLTASLARREGDPLAPVSDLAADTATLLAPFDGTPVLELLELADRQLAAALAGSGRAAEAPPARLVRVGPDGVEIWLGAPVDWSPGGWRLQGDRAWHLPATTDPHWLATEALGYGPWLPALLPVGDDARGTWLVPVGPGSVLPVLGAGAPELVSAMQAAATAWSWAEQVVVTTEAAVAEREASALGGTRPATGPASPVRWHGAPDPGTPGEPAPGEGPEAGTGVVFVGNPDALSTGTRARCAVLTTLPAAATDLTVVVDAQGASLHPLGVTVRSQHLDRDRVVALDELMRAPEPRPAQTEGEARPAAHTGAGDDGRTRSRGAVGLRSAPGPRATARLPGVAAPSGRSGTPDGSRSSGTPGTPDTPGPSDTPGSSDTPGPLGSPTPRPSTAGTPPPDVAELLEPGPVEVHLLTAVPRIDGLVEALPANRARRGTELVAYLALHHPDPVTSDRLRAQVLGSADADAAAKTLFNTVGASRRALGRGPDGEHLLPMGTKSGHYRVSSLVTVDVIRAAGLVAAAGGAGNDDESMALLRAALALVEGEPLAGTLTGYAWWIAEGHGRRIAALLVDGACRLARLASAGGYLDLARWGLEQARLVEPYSELLARAAMEVAAEAGDAELLRREWVECQRWMDELDPGSLPSEATERLYTELRRRVPAHAGDERGP